MRLIKLFMTVLLFGCAAAAYADPPSRVARLNYIAGPVSFAPADAPDAWGQAVLNRPLTTGDRLWADDRGRAELHLGSTAIRVAAFTSVDFLNLDDESLQMRLAQGTLNLRIRDLEPGDVIEVATPGGAVLVRQPGSYRISTDPQSDATRVQVSFGQAEVVTPLQTVTVPSGQTAAISQVSGIAFEIAQYASADEFDRWSSERDRREDRVTSTRYVSREMTGYEDLDQYGTWRTLPEYGAVWVPTRVSSGWAPYRHGHWAWVSPWGWTWIDDAPWGFAPFHYGRWVSTGGYWAWAPGAVVRRPVYAPALVAFVGGSRWSVSARSGPAVGWFPLGHREPYRPWYRASERHVQNVNVTHVTNVTNVYNTTNVTHIHRRNPQAVTVVPQQAFVSARPVAQATVPVATADLARAEPAQAAPPARPARASFAPERAGRRPPDQATAREVVAVTPPAQPAAQTATPATQGSGTAAPTRRSDTEPRVRVIGRERADGRDRGDPRPDGFRAPAAGPAPAASASQPATAATAAPTASSAAPAAVAPASRTPAISAPSASSQTPAPTAAAASSPPPATVTRAAPGAGATPAPAAAAAATPAAAPPAAPGVVPSPAPAAAAPAATRSIAPSAASAPPPSAAATPSAPQSQAQRRFGAEDRRSGPREPIPPQTAPSTVTFSSTPPAPPAPQPPRAEQRAPQIEQRAAQREQVRQERATARLEERTARPAPAPEARPPMRLEERRPRAEDEPRARPAAPQPTATLTASPQREVRAERAQPAAAAPATPRPAAGPRPAEAPRPAPAPREDRRPPQ